MLPSLAALSHNSKRTRSGDGFLEQSDPLELLLTDLPPEIHHMVLLALAQNDCKTLAAICIVSHEFAQICREDRFWQAALLGAGWAPDWSPIESPGGMSPKAYYKMVCGLEDRYRQRLLALSLTLTTIERDAFRGCSSLALTHLPPNITTISIRAFEDCTSLTLTHLPPNLTEIGRRAFQGCISLALTHLPPNITSIEDYAFEGCSSLALTHLPPNLTKLLRRAFAYCTSLTLTHLPPNITKISLSAFEGCSSLALTHLPPNLTKIEEFVFQDCTSLALTHLPPNLTEIGRRAFYGCEQLLGGDFEAQVRRLNPLAF